MHCSTLYECAAGRTLAALHKLCIYLIPYLNLSFMLRRMWGWDRIDKYTTRTIDRDRQNIRSAKRNCSVIEREPKQQGNNTKHNTNAHHTPQHNQKHRSVWLTQEYPVETPLVRLHGMGLPKWSHCLPLQGGSSNTHCKAVRDGLYLRTGLGLDPVGSCQR